MDKEIFDLAIIGAGPAGMTAAIYALRARKSVLIFEQNAIGGQILPAIKIANYPALPDVSGQDFSAQLKHQVKSLGGNFVLEKVEKITPPSPQTTFSLLADDVTYLARSVILANGSAERHLNLPGERELVGHGLSYCATCDGPLFSGETVAVYGGGSSALSSALYLANLAQKIYLITRSTRLRAEEGLIERAKNLPNLEFLPNHTIAALKSTPSSHLNASSKPAPVFTGVVLENSLTHDKQLLALDGLFISIGRTADNSAWHPLVDLDDSGYILANESCLTKTPGLFCAGDTRKKPLNQLVTATSDGAIAAAAAISYLRDSAP